MLTILFVLTCGLRYFWKREDIRKNVRWNRELRYHCRLSTGISKKSMLSLSTFLFFLVINRILKALFSFIPWLLNSSDLSSYASDLSKRYTLRFLLMFLEKSTTSIWGISSPFDSLRWVPFSLALHLWFC